MDKQLLIFLKEYSFDPDKINRLLVSSFLLVNNISVNHNELIKSLIIQLNDDDYVGLAKFLELVPEMTFENLIQVFEHVISPVDKIVTGAVYTPKSVRDFIVSNVFGRFHDLNVLKICDPACGCSGFLYTAAMEIKKTGQKSYSEIFEQNLFGIDIQGYSILRSKVLLSLLALYHGEDERLFKFNLHTGNSLSFEWRKVIPNFQGFQAVLGNPPYVSSKNIDAETRGLLGNWSVTSTGHPDLYIPFFQLAIENLAPNGVLGYITMNSFFKSLNGRAIREYLVTNSWELTILDFGGFQIFKSKNTYTCIFILQKRPAGSVAYGRFDNGNIDAPVTTATISYEMLESLDGWNLSNYLLVKKIEETGSKLGTMYTTRNGIATLKNDVYILQPVKSDKSFHYFLRKGVEIKVEKAVCVDIINPNKLIKKNEIDPLRKKIIFPYTYEKGIAKIVPEKEFSSKYPEAYKYLVANAVILSKRDKGEGEYEAWYAYGRRQSFDKSPFKLFFPHITPITPFFVISDDENLLFHNGMAIFSDNHEDLVIIQKLMRSTVFWFYVTNASKPYSSDYYSLSRNYIKNFGVFNFTDEQRAYILNEMNEDTLNLFFERIYDLNL
jgi:hypothetical protein